MNRAKKIELNRGRLLNNDDDDDEEEKMIARK
jgi:hypothetical protein